METVESLTPAEKDDLVDELAGWGLLAAAASPWAAFVAMLANAQRAPGHQFGFSGFVSNPNYKTGGVPPTGNGSGGNQQYRVTIQAIRNGSLYTGAGYFTIDGINNSPTNGTWINLYDVGKILTISFTGLGLACTPTVPIQITVKASSSQVYSVLIPC